MSANRDKNQKFTFVYSNLYQIYRKSRENTAEVTDEPFPISKGKVIKAGSPAQPDSPKVSPYSPVEFIAKRVEPAQSHQQPPLEGLKQNLKALQDLQSRLRFMLQELEELMKQ